MRRCPDGRSGAGSVTSAAVGTLVLIAIAAVLAPILSELTGRLAIPEIVIQIGLGILIGPYVLEHRPREHRGHRALRPRPDLPDLPGRLRVGPGQRIRGRPLRLATTGWGISLVIGLGAAFALVSTGLARDTVVVGLALTTTALGTLVPMLRDAGVMDTRFGAYISAIGTVASSGPSWPSPSC